MTATPNPIPAADSFGACPDCTNNHHTYEPCPQPEKREGPPFVVETRVGGWTVVGRGLGFGDQAHYRGPDFKDEHRANDLAHDLNHAFRAGQSAQPEGDEWLRLAAKLIEHNERFNSCMNAAAYGGMDTREIQIAWDKLAAALGSGEGGKA